MKTKLRGLRDIPSITRLGSAGRRHARYEYEILNELTQLGREKVRLNKEREKWRERIDWIDERVREIAEQEGSLKQQMAVKEKIVLDVQGAKEAADKENSEVIIKY